jgi:hypothetical protein
MDIHEFHKRVIMEAVFDGVSSVFPLSIVLASRPNPYGRGIIYDGVHFVDTPNLLSIQLPKYSLLVSHFDKNGVQLNSPIGTDCAFTFSSLEIQLWCERVIAGSKGAFDHCNQPYIYRDGQFGDFERIAMKFPAYEAMISGATGFGRPSDELAAELDRELLRLRRLLL